MIDRLNRWFGDIPQTEQKQALLISPIREHPYINPAASLEKLHEQFETDIATFGNQLVDLLDQPTPTLTIKELDLDTQAGIPAFLENWQPAAIIRQEEE